MSETLAPETERVSGDERQSETIDPRIAAVEMLDEFSLMAQFMCPSDPSTQDDLVQEMALRTLLFKMPQTRHKYRLAAADAAIVYLRWWCRPALYAEHEEEWARRKVAAQRPDEDAAAMVPDRTFFALCRQLRLHKLRGYCQ